MRNALCTLFLVSIACLGCASNRGRGGARDRSETKGEDVGAMTPEHDDAGPDATLDSDAVRPPDGADASSTVVDAGGDGCTITGYDLGRCLACGDDLRLTCP